MENEKTVVIPDRREQNPEPIGIIKKAAPGLIILGVTTTASAILLLISTLFVIKLAPVVKSVDALDNRVSAIETTDSVNSPHLQKVVEDVATIKADVSNIKEDTSLIKNYILNK